MKAIFVLLLMTTAVAAKDFTVTDEDQANIVSICAVAARSPAVDITINAQIASWCVNWQTRIKAMAAAKVAPQEEPR